jgi:hypothetical protein
LNLKAEKQTHRINVQDAKAKEERLYLGQTWTLYYYNNKTKVERKELDKLFHGQCE